MALPVPVPLFFFAPEPYRCYEYIHVVPGNGSPGIAGCFKHSGNCSCWVVPGEQAGELLLLLSAITVGLVLARMVARRMIRNRAKSDRHATAITNSYEKNGPSSHTLCAEGRQLGRTPDSSGLNPES